MSVFEPRINLKPYEYPHLLEYKEAIRNSYWTHDEFKSEVLSDMQDYDTIISPSEQQIIARAMLAISQIEVNVKLFWGDVYRHCPKPEISSVGQTFGDCHVEGTEVLTPTGWKLFENINIGDSVLQFTSKDTIEETKVLNKVEYDYNGDIYYLKKQAFEAGITPNHKIVFKNRRKDDIQLLPVSEVSLSNTDNFWIESSKKNGKIDTLTNEERLFIAIQADGSQKFWKNNKTGERKPRGSWSNCFTYEISLKKERKQKRLKQLLELCSFKYVKENISKNGYVKYRIDIPNDYNYKSFEWVNVCDKSWKWCESFVQELAEWDGYRLPNKKDCKIKYSTTNKKNADIVQMIGVCAGYKSNISTYNDTRKDKNGNIYGEVYTVSFVSNREKVSFGPIKPHIEHYQGRVRCITVESGMIITRYKDSTFISGNSEARHMDAYSFLLEVMGLDDEFEKLLEVPAIIGRINYLKKYQTGLHCSPEDYTKSLFLFALFVEGVSLFGQFLILMSFNKHRNIFKGIANIVSATFVEEMVHLNFGVELIRIIREEHPEYFDETFYTNIKDFCLKAYRAEIGILEWIFESGELDFLPVSDIDEFLKDRFNRSFESLDLDPIFEVNEDVLSRTKWLDEQNISSSHSDFFHVRPTSYSKNNKSFTTKDLF